MRGMQSPGQPIRTVSTEDEESPSATEAVSRPTSRIALPGRNSTQAAAEPTPNSLSMRSGGLSLSTVLSTDPNEDFDVEKALEAPNVASTPASKPASPKPETPKSEARTAPPTVPPRVRTAPPKEILGENGDNGKPENQSGETASPDSASSTEKPSQPTTGERAPAASKTTPTRPSGRTARTEQNPEAASRPRPVADTGAEERKPIDPYHPPVKTAAFMHVIPGVTEHEELFEHWGEPVDGTENDDQVVYLFSMEVLNHIEVTVRGEIVRSIVIRLDEPFPEDQVRGVLRSELLKAKPVLMPDEKGRITGEIFPEKGVMFLFAPPEAGPGLLVQQIAIEPVTAEPFVLRAEALLTEQPAEAKRDLEDAIRLSPENAKSYWLLAQVALMEGRYDEALKHCEKAIRRDRTKPGYHLTLVQIMIQMNHVEEAKLYLEEMMPLCDRYPHEKARAVSLLGDLYRTCKRPDHEMAVECHYDAIHLASSLVEHNNQTIRQSAKDVLFEAHLAAARDVVWGRWDNKPEAIRKWIGKAIDFATDPEMVDNRRYSREYPLKIAACALAAQVALPESNDLEPYVLELIDTAEELIQSTRDPILLRKYQWEASLALYDAVQIYQIRRQYSAALKYGELAAEYMEQGIQGRENDLDFYLLGRLYFRMGAIHAIGTKNHRAAIEWFEPAKGVFEQLLPRINPDELGRLGETMVSMGVSYWWTGQHDEAIRLTERGMKQVERATKMGVIGRAALAIPYSNLANMYGELGMEEKAEYYTRQASTAENTLK